MGYLVADPGAAKLAKPSWNGSLFNLGLKYQILYNPWKIFIVKNAWSDIAPSGCGLTKNIFWPEMILEKGVGKGSSTSQSHSKLFR
jgi:hypothetical protein